MLLLLSIAGACGVWAAFAYFTYYLCDPWPTAKSYDQAMVRAEYIGYLSSGVVTAIIGILCLLAAAALFILY